MTTRATRTIPGVMGNQGILRETLGEAGHRLTSPRLAVWQVLSESPGHLTAEQIADRVSDIDPAVNLSSIYRSLSLFAELGLARESHLGPDEPSHWELAHSDDQFHLRCVSCGRVTHHSGDLVAQIRDHLSGEHGFDAESIDLLVTGVCVDCAN